MKRVKSIGTAGAILGGLLALAGTGSAETQPPPQPTPTAAGPTFEVLYDIGARTRYETDLSGYGNTGFDVKRSAVLAQLSYGDFFLSGGTTYDARIEPRAATYYPMPMERSAAYGWPTYEQPEDPTGDGFVITAGLRSRIWEQDKFSLHAHGQLSFRRETYDATATYVSYPVYATEGPAAPDIWPTPTPTPEPVTYTETYNIDLRSTELLAGLTGAFTGMRYTAYAGLEFRAYSDVEADVTVTSSDGSSYSETSSVDSSDMVTLLLGLRASFDRAFVLVEARSLGENSLRAGVGIAF